MDSHLRMCIAVLALVILFTSGCAVGNKHRYNDVVANIDTGDSISIGVATHDHREYVVNGKKNPDFVGLSRGGYGNPFDVRTLSGRSLAEDITETISASLSNRGYEAIPVIVANSEDHAAVIEMLKKTGAKRLILLKLEEWKSDTYTNTALIFDIKLHVFDQTGQVLAEKQLNGRDNLKGNIINPPEHARNVIPRAFQGKIEQLLNDPSVSKALH